VSESISIRFSLDGHEVTAAPGETIWEVAKRAGTTLPHLCHADSPGYRPDGNCRARMVEIDGERVLAASCIRKPAEGMVVKTATPRTHRRPRPCALRCRTGRSIRRRLRQDNQPPAQPTAPFRE
jgi:predicted molibdopterin-dependent oxidoreductase YjgC